MDRHAELLVVHLFGETGGELPGGMQRQGIAYIAGDARAPRQREHLDGAATHEDGIGFDSRGRAAGRERGVPPPMLAIQQQHARFGREARSR